MERKLSVTAACNAASQCVGNPVKYNQTAWQMFYHEPDETATRTMRADSYSNALEMMVETKALMAIELLGKSWGYAWNNGPDIEVYLKITEGGNWRKAVSFAHKQAITQ